MKYWPRVDSQKEIDSLSELETILDCLTSISPIIEIRQYLVSRVINSAQSDHHSVAERALLLLHNPVLLALIKYDKAGLLKIVVNGLLSNVHRKDKMHIDLIRHNGTFVQTSTFDDLQGAHWSQHIRGLTLVALKNLTEQVDRIMVEDLAGDAPRNLEAQEKEKYLRRKKWR